MLMRLSVEVVSIWFFFVFFVSAYVDIIMVTLLILLEFRLSDSAIWIIQVGIIQKYLCVCLSNLSKYLVMKPWVYVLTCVGINFYMGFKTLSVSIAPRRIKLWLVTSLPYNAESSSHGVSTSICSFVLMMYSHHQANSHQC